MGIMTSPNIGNLWPEGIPWAADNGCFSAGDSFDQSRWLSWLGGLPHRDSCLFAVAPDVVADFAATLERSCPMLEIIRSLGYPVALVGQDGAERRDIPWGAFDAWFVGGTTEWKLSPVSRELCQQAKRHGKWVHMGRVNSFRRYHMAKAWGCDSVDGTFLKYGPKANWPRLVEWISQESLPLEAG